MAEARASASSLAGRAAFVAETRDVELVPYVEIAEGRLQGVVSSGSEIERVYCAYVEAGSFAYYSSTNNDRPDGGTAKRLLWLIEAAVAQYGAARVLAALEIPLEPGPRTAAEVHAHVLGRGTPRKENSGRVFSRFLEYLRFVELPAPQGPQPGMSWFVG